MAEAPGEEFAEERLKMCSGGAGEIQGVGMEQRLGLGDTLQTREIPMDVFGLVRGAWCWQALANELRRRGHPKWLHGSASPKIVGRLQ